MNQVATMTLEEIDRDLRDLRSRRNYLLDARTDPSDVARAVEIEWLDAQEHTLLKQRSALLRSS